MPRKLASSRGCKKRAMAEMHAISFTKCPTAGSPLPPLRSVPALWSPRLEWVTPMSGTPIRRATAWDLGLELRDRFRLTRLLMEAPLLLMIICVLVITGILHVPKAPLAVSASNLINEAIICTQLPYAMIKIIRGI